MARTDPKQAREQNETDKEMIQICLQCALPAAACDRPKSYRCPYMARYGRSKGNPRAPAVILQHSCGAEGRIGEWGRLLCN